MPGMATTFYFAEEPGREPCEALAWFRRLSEPFVEIEHASGAKGLHFLDMGSLAKKPDGSLDAAMSPLVTLFPPTARRRVLWSLGEVHFQTANLRAKYPRLQSIQNSFRKWISDFAVVFDQRSGPGPFGYYLEGGCQNVADKIYALPSGLAALDKGQYFVLGGGNDTAYDGLCRTLRLRGVECGT